MSQFRRLSILALIALFTLLVFPSGVSAEKPLFLHEEWDETDTLTNFCGVTGLTVEGHFTGSVDGIVRFNKSRFGFFSTHVTFFDTLTGPNGEVVTVSAKRHEQDIEVIDNGDGTLSIQNKVTGAAFTVTGPDGERSLDRGLVVFAFTVDYNDTPDNPFDDDFVSDQGIVRMAGPHPGLESDVVCEIAVPAFTS